MFESHHIQTIQRMTTDELRALVSSGFDANHYLHENPDVRLAGCPALDHYLDYGWLEGRRPSAHFAACASMFDMVELRAMGVDPFALFLLMRATSQPFINADAHAALDADPLASHRMQGHVRYAAALAGTADWAGVMVESTHDNPLRRATAGNRLALGAYVGRPLVILPDRDWPGALSLARALDERHVAFLHFGDATSAEGWRVSLSNVVGLPPALADERDTSAALLLLDALRGVAPPLFVDLGARAVSVALTSQRNLLPRAPMRVVAFVSQTDDMAWIRDVEGITRVTLLSDPAAIKPGQPPDELAIDPSTFTREQSRDFVTRIFADGI